MQAFLAKDAKAVTPSDTVSMECGRALYVGGAGDLTVVMREESNVVTFAAVPAGTVLPMQVRRVNATGTTATNIVALY